MDKRKLIGAVALLIVFVFVFRFSREEEPVDQDKAEAVIRAMEMIKEDRERMPEEPEGSLTQKLEEVPVIEITGLTDEALSVLDVSAAEVASEVKAWADGNGHTGTVGAAFYNTMLIDFAEGKYSVEFRLVRDAGGNGIQPGEDAEQVYTMDYYQGDGLFQFH